MICMAARRTFLFCAILASGFAFVACGGGSDSETPTESATGATTGAIEQADPLANVRSALEADGYSVVTAPSSDADASIRVDDLVGIAYYADAAEARSVGKEISGVYKQFPGRGIVVSQGNLIIDMGRERTLKPAELVEFNKVTAIALKATQE